MSATRAKEKRRTEMSILERKWFNLVSESTVLSEELEIVEKESKELENENKMLKEQLEMVANQITLRDSLQDQMERNIQRIKIELGFLEQNAAAGTNPLLYNNAPTPVQLAAQGLQNLQLENQNQFSQVQTSQIHFQFQQQMSGNGFQDMPDGFGGLRYGQQGPIFQNPEPRLPSCFQNQAQYKYNHQ